MSYDNSSPGVLQARIQLGEIQANLPYTTYEEDDVVAFADGSLSLGIEIFPEHLDLLDHESINGKQRTLVNLLNGLPEGTAVQFDLFSSTDLTPQLIKHFKPEEDASENGQPPQWKVDRPLFEMDRKMVRRYLEERMRQGTIRHWRNFVFINYHEPRSTWQNPVMFFKDALMDVAKSFRGRAILQEELQAYRDRVMVLRNISSGFKSIFENLAWYPREMAADDWSEVLLQLYNPRLHEMGYQPCYRGYHSIPHDPDFMQTFLFSQIHEYSAGVWEMDGYHHTIYTLPEIKAGATIFGIMRHLSNAGIPNMRISVVGRPCDPASYLKQIRRELNGLRNEEKRKPDDGEIKKAIIDRLAEQDQVLQGIQKIFETRITMHLWDRNPDKLKEYTTRLAKVGQDMGGARWLQEAYNALPYFFSTTPGWTNDRDDARINEFKSYTFVDVLPLYQPFDPSSGLDGRGKGSQAPVIIENSNQAIAGWNPMDFARGTNYNGIILGATRRGKSVGQQHIMMMMAPLNPRFTCIDLGESSKTLIEALGGVHYTIIDKRNEEDCKRINPFGGAKGLPKPEELDDYTHVVEQMLLERDQDGLERERRAILQAALAETFKRNPDREIFVEDLRLTLAGKADDPKAKELAKLLYTWTQGTLARFVNGPSEVNLDNPFVGFELDGIQTKPELQPVILSMIFNHAKRMAAQHRHAPKAIWTDEFGTLGKSKALSRYMEIAYRTYGKTGTGVWTLSQQIGDYALCAPQGQIGVFLNNVGQFIIFGQEEAAVQGLREHTTLSEDALQVIQNLKTIKGHYAEAVIIQRQQSRDVCVGKVLFRSNPIKYWLSTSSPNDRIVRDCYVERFQAFEGTRQRALQRAILALADDLPAGYDSAGLGQLTPQTMDQLRAPTEADKKLWDPYGTALAETLGISKTQKPEYMTLKPIQKRQ